MLCHMQAADSVTGVGLAVDRGHANSPVGAMAHTGRQVVLDMAVKEATLCHGKGQCRVSKKTSQRYVCRSNNG